MRFAYVMFVLSVMLFIASAAYSSWCYHNRREANLPVSGIETLVAALRDFHKRTGRFPKDFRELDEKIWQGTKKEQISNDGKSLTASLSNYHYTLHTINPANRSDTKAPVKAAIWAVPVGPRSNEAATQFWYVTPTEIEKWMGPALTSQNICVVKTIPTEQQLALLVMMKQATDKTRRQTASRSLFPFSLFQ
jgi:hypothetical protein